MLKLGVVSYLNAKPLIAGLEADPGISLTFDVPAKLPKLLDERLVDAALVPVIDVLQRAEDWCIVSDACIGCDGETLTVRVFSRVDPAQIRQIHIDGDSHTSVALARIIWFETFAREVELIPYQGNESLDECEAILLIGDKVVTDKRLDYHIETDLGTAWKSLTGLPFVFAVWAMPAGEDEKAERIAEVLARARDQGVESASMIAEDFGPGMGWPVALARRYLTARLKFHLGPKQRVGMEKFLECARRRGILSNSGGMVFA